MTRRETIEAAAMLGAILRERTPAEVNVSRIADAACTLMREAVALNTINERLCNEADTFGAIEKRGGYALERVTCALDAIGARVRVTWQRDPRGYALRLHADGLRGNTFGGDEAGYGV